jgi:hypothetical protein
LFPESIPFGLRPLNADTLGEDVDPGIFEPRVSIGRTGVTRQLSMESVFDGVTIAQLLAFDYGETTRGRRTEPTAISQEQLKDIKHKNRETKFSLINPSFV